MSRASRKSSRRGTRNIHRALPALGASRYPSKFSEQVGTRRRRELSVLASTTVLPRSESTSNDLSKRRRKSFIQAPRSPRLQKPAIIGARTARLVARDSFYNSRVQAVDEVCVRRKKRREVIHATGRAGANVVRKLPKYTWRSLIKCKKG